MDDAPILLSAEETRYWIDILESQIADNRMAPVPEPPMALSHRRPN
jgi:hypothetical protein